MMVWRRGQDKRFREYEALADGTFRATGRVAGDKEWRLGHDGMLHQFELTTGGYRYTHKKRKP
jgi:hypothetical protein